MQHSGIEISQKDAILQGVSDEDDYGLKVLYPSIQYKPQDLMNYTEAAPILELYFRISAPTYVGSYRAAFRRRNLVTNSIRKPNIRKELGSLSGI